MYSMCSNHNLSLQVADVFVYRLHHNNDWPRYVPGLAHCLVDHLDLAPEQVHAMKVRDGYQEVWLLFQI